MQIRLLEILACPDCLADLHCSPSEVPMDGEIETGSLGCRRCGKTFLIEAGIPRFVESDNYSSSFGYQWNRFKAEQIDSVNQTDLSAQRFFKETGWSPEWLEGKWILDVGCGAGRFLDVASRSSCDVVGVDLSNATDAARSTLGGRRNVHLVQASIYGLPFKSSVFDGCYCIGVIQHTPDPQASLKALPRVLKKDGRVAVTIYERKRWTLLNTKYLIRPLTKRLNKNVLLNFIKGLMPIFFPLTEVLFRIPYLGRFFMYAIPVANYVGEDKLSLRQRYAWAVLDTFDMLSPQYDQPRTQEEAEAALSNAGIVDLRRLPNSGLNLVGIKAA
ncbi:MAG: methyltransferase domain-containing protein [Acidobacteriota bacterium]